MEREEYSKQVLANVKRPPCVMLRLKTAVSLFFLVIYSKVELHFTYTFKKIKCAINAAFTLQPALTPKCPPVQNDIITVDMCSCA